MKEQTRNQLLQMAEGEYQKFSAALNPGVDNMLGIRLPELRRLAKQLAKGDWRKELQTEDVYFEETMLRGMIISYAREDMDEILPYIEEFIPYVNNWSVCDCVFAKMEVLQKDRDRTWEFIQPYLHSGEEFKVRVALLIMMQHLLKCDIEGNKMPRVRTISMEDIDGGQLEDELQIAKQGKAGGKYLEKILNAIDRPFTEGYYAHMAAAWLVAEAFCCFPARTAAFLQNNHLDDKTYNKALQKITESLIPQPEVKSYIRSLKRKKE